MYDRVRELILEGKVTNLSEFWGLEMISVRRLATDAGIVYARLLFLRTRPGQVMVDELQLIAPLLKLKEEELLRLFINEKQRLSKL